MKTKLASILILIATIIGLTGCASTGGKMTVADATPAIKTAASIGTYAVLREHPEWRAQFIVAANDLEILEHADTIDFATIMAIVQRLPVKKLQSDKAQLAITATTMLLAGYGDRIVALDKMENMRPIVKALREGVEIGMQ
jgi:hypothetical protein